MRAFEKLNWSIERSAPRRSETHVIAVRAVRRVKEGTLSGLIQSGFQESWRSEAMECCCCLRNVQDSLAGGQTPPEFRFNSPLEATIIRFGAEVKFNLVL